MNTEQLLCDKILFYNNQYRKGTPKISDIEYDNMLEKYKTITSYNPQLYLDLRTKLFEDGGKIKHPYLMGSLEKIKAEDESSSIEWSAKNIADKYLVMAKIDGISCRLKYEYGTLVEAATRGDGKFGEDILEKIKLIKNIPYYISSFKNIHECNIRGELVITDSDFNMLNEISDNKFKNSRNATAGIINRKKDIGYIKYVSFFAYEIMNSSDNRVNQLTTLAASFDIVNYNMLDSNNLNNANLMDYYNELLHICPYTIDGLVMCADTYTGENELIPDGMIAFKANMLKGTSTVIDVDWGTPSKDGKLIPVISIVPIELGGSVIQRVTAYNAEWLKTSNLKYGSDVVIMKSGDVIPKIIEIINSESSNDKTLIDIEWPEECPCCGTPTIMVGVDCVCPNSECQNRTQEQAFLFIKKLGIKNIAKKTLINIELNSIEDVLDETKYVYNTPSIKKFYNELTQLLYSTDFGKLLSCCNFNGISDKTFNKLWEVIENDVPMTPGVTEDYINIIKQKLISNLPKGIGMASVNAFINSLDRNLNMIWKITSSDMYNPIKKVSSNSQIIGSVCFTGSLNTMSRNEASAKAEIAGYKVLSGVTNKLTYLVTNDRNSNSSKNKKARELGIKVISEAEFLEIIKGKDVTVESSIDLL